MRTSARNQFAGTVAAIKAGAVNDEIELAIAGGHRIVAVITHGSTRELGLEMGAEAYALIKASSVILVAEGNGARYSARNQLRGTVARVLAGAVNTEVVIDLPGGPTVAAIVTNDSSEALELAAGAGVTAIFKASSVILAVPN